MATATRKARTRRPAPEPEVEEVEEAPQKEVRGTAWLTDYVNEECDTTYSPASIRILLRRLVKDGVLAREIGEDRSRYTFEKGANDPIVKAVIKAVKSGEAKEAQKEQLAKVKEKAAAKKATAEKPARRTRSKAKPKPEVIEDEEFDEDDIEDL